MRAKVPPGATAGLSYDTGTGIEYQLIYDNDESYSIRHWTDVPQARRGSVLRPYRQLQFIYLWAPPHIYCIVEDTYYSTTVRL